MSAETAETAAEPELIVPVIENEFWLQDSACYGTNINFDAPGTRGRTRADGTRKLGEDEKLIAQYCLRCVSRKDCLAYSLQIGETNGVTGGLTQKERAPLVASMKKLGGITAEQWNTEHVFPPNTDFATLQAEVTIHTPAGTATVPRPRPAAVPKKETPAASADKPAAAPGRQATPEAAVAPANPPAEAVVSIESIRGRIKAKQSMLVALKGLPADQIRDQKVTLLREIDVLRAQEAAIA